MFWIGGRIPPGLKPRLVAILALGALQGAIGWWMVASGLSVRTDVSQYRLAVHLTTACIIFVATLWVARGLEPAPAAAPPSSKSVYVGALIVVLALFQIYLGGLVAGLNAGLTFNTWPLMDGHLVPNGLLLLKPLWRNLFENPMTVQFTHRMGAYTLLAVVVLHAVAAYVQAPRSRHTTGAIILVALVLGQASLGIATLLTAVPIPLGLAHQAGALVVLGGAVVHARGMTRRYATAATV